MSAWQNDRLHLPLLRWAQLRQNDEPRRRGRIHQLRLTSSLEAFVVSYDPWQGEQDPFNVLQSRVWRTLVCETQTPPLGHTRLPRSHERVK